MGPAAVGVQLTADPGLWSAGAILAYQWLLDGVALPGATAATFTPDPTMAGDALQVIVTGTTAGERDVTASSNIVVIGAGGAPTAKTAPKKTASHSTLSVTTGVWSVSGLVFSYQWYEGDATDEANAIAGATQSTYTLTGGQVAANVHAKVTATRDRLPARQRDRALAGPCPRGFSAVPRGKTRATRDFRPKNASATGLLNAFRAEPPASPRRSPSSPGCRAGTRRCS